MKTTKAESDAFDASCVDLMPEIRSSPEEVARRASTAKRVGLSLIDRGYMETFILASEAARTAAIENVIMSLHETGPLNAAARAVRMLEYLNRVMPMDIGVLTKAIFAAAKEENE